jgi:ERF superfamily
MKTSDSLDKIAPALVKAQTAMTFAKKDTTNPHFKSTFAGLPSVIDAVKGPLNDNGIAFIQTPSPSEDGKLHLTTRLIHTSGQWIEDTAVCPLPKADPQGFGSASTYIRRYSLAAITGLYQDDDDGEGATRGEPEKPDPAKEKPLGTTVIALATTDQISELSMLSLDGCEDRIKAALKAYKRTKIGDFTEAEAAKVLKKLNAERAAAAIN